MSRGEWMPDPGPCKNCDGPLKWREVGGAWVHSDRGHWWCFPERKGYDQPTATPSNKPETKP